MQKCDVVVLEQLGKAEARNFVQLIVIVVHQMWGFSSSYPEAFYNVP